MSTEIAPGFLVAAPQLEDPNFAKTVVLMIDHEDDEGSLGLVINRPSALDLSSVIAGMGLDIGGAVELADHPPLLYGGPVSPERGWILHSPEWSGPDTREVAPGLAVSASMDTLQDIFGGDGPEKYRFLLGYSGWGPGQLVEEIKAGAWINVPYSAELVFDTPVDDCWKAAIARLGFDPSQLASTVGDA